MEGIQCKSQIFNLKSPDKYEYGRDDRGGSCEPSDVVDLLPSDPFGMNIGATLTAITGWIDILKTDAMNSIWNQARKFPSDEELRLGGSFDQAVQYDPWINNVEYDMWLKDKEFRYPNCSVYSSTADGKAQETVVAAEETYISVVGSCFGQSGSDPHEAILYVLGYLDVNDLLNVERVCKTLHSAVRNDPLLWRNICIDRPLNGRIDDSALIRIVSRAQGNLESLSLLNCSRITDAGLRQVLGSNPRLQKLSVPECTKLSIEGILTMLKDIQIAGAPGIKLLRIGGRHDVTGEKFEELKMILGMDESALKRKPRIYHGRYSHCHYDDDNRIIDIEVCPLCEKVRVVYDCPIDCCQMKQDTMLSRRACTICISRCVQCGRCLNDVKYVETFSLDDLCSYCSEQQLEVGTSHKHTIAEQEIKYEGGCG